MTSASKEAGSSCDRYTILRRCGRQPPDDSKFHYSLRPSPLLVKIKKGTRKIVNYNGFELFFTILLGWMVVDLTSRMIICQFFYDQPEVIEEVSDGIVLSLVCSPWTPYGDLSCWIEGRCPLRIASGGLSHEGD